LKKCNSINNRWLLNRLDFASHKSTHLRTHAFLFGFGVEDWTQGLRVPGELCTTELHPLFAPLSLKRCILLTWTHPKDEWITQKRAYGCSPECWEEGVAQSVTSKLVHFMPRSSTGELGTWLSILSVTRKPY
jgi:hypothetical protein